MKSKFLILLTWQIAIIAAGGSSCCRGNRDRVRVLSSIPDKNMKYGRYDSDKEFRKDPLIAAQDEYVIGSPIFLLQKSWKKLYPLEPVSDPDVMLFETEGEDLIMHLETEGLRKKLNIPENHATTLKTKRTQLRVALDTIKTGLKNKDYTHLFNDLFEDYESSPIFRWKPRLYAVLVQSLALRSESQWQMLSPPDGAAVLFKNKFGLVLKQHGNNNWLQNQANDHIQELLQQGRLPELFSRIISRIGNNDMCRALLEEIVPQMDEHQIKLKLKYVLPKDNALIAAVNIGIPKILSIFIKGKNFKQKQLDETLKYIVDRGAEKGYREMAKILQEKGANAPNVSKKLEDLRDRRNDGCCICWEKYETIHVRDCDHLICENCEKSCPTVSKPCPICRKNGDKSRPSVEYNHKRKKLEEMKKTLDAKEDYKKEPQGKNMLQKISKFLQNLLI